MLFLHETSNCKIYLHSTVTSQTYRTEVVYVMVWKYCSTVVLVSKCQEMRAITTAIDVHCTVLCAERSYSGISGEALGDSKGVYRTFGCWGSKSG